MISPLISRTIARSDRSARLDSHLGGKRKLKAGVGLGRGRFGGVRRRQTWVSKTRKSRYPHMLLRGRAGSGAYSNEPVSSR